MTNPLLDTSALPRFRDLRPQHTLPALRELIAAHRQALDALLDDPQAHDFESLIYPLEEMQHELRRVWSPVVHLQSVLDDPEWREAYNEGLRLITEQETALAQDARLYAAYRHVAEQLPDDAPAARRSLLAHGLRDFQLAGVTLPEDDKAQFRELRQQIAALQAAFDQNVQDSTDGWALHVADADLAGLPESVVTRAHEAARERGLEGGRLTLDLPTWQAVSMHAENRELREKLYRAWSTRASDQADDARWDNSANIEQLLEGRHRAAGLVGFGNYAELSLATKMASSTDEVTGFLRELAARTRPAAEAELQALQALAPYPLEAWDVSYWIEKLKQQQYSLSDELLRAYFPADGVRDGLFGLASRLYGVTLLPRDDVETWHPAVRFYDVCAEGGAAIGGFYTDLYARSGKRNGAWIDECIGRKNLSGEIVAPVGYLVCNFPPPAANGVSLLTHSDVVTLFHEFGHMLHHLLTRIDYPAIAGINGVPWDAVELPSQFMENFAWNRDVLRRASGHVETGEPLPDDLFTRLLDSRHCGAALAMLRQIELALFDFCIHARYDPANKTRPLELLAKIRDEIALVRHPDYNRFPHSFAHIFAGGYAAGYYSYKWAEVLAADAFSAFEEAGIFDSSTASRFRREILEVGGSCDIMQAFVAFRGRRPTLDALLRHSGIGMAA